MTWITPAYNRAHMIGETIESVLAQDYPAIEYLVLDDGSTDETPTVIAEYARRHPERIRHLRHDNRGEARTVNLGFELARGELVGKLSDDDLLDPGATRALVEPFVDDPDVVVSYPQCRVIDEQGTPQYEILPLSFSLVESLRLADPIVVVGALVRAGLARELGGWDPELPHCPDVDFWLRAARHGEFRLIEEVLASKRRHPGSISSAAAHGPVMARERIRVVDKYFETQDPPDEVLAHEREIYRATCIQASRLVGEYDPMHDRYIVIDTHARTRVRPISEQSQLETRLTRSDPQELAREHETTIKRLHREVFDRDEHIRRLERELAARDSRAPQDDTSS